MHSFELIREEEVADINSKVKLYRHVKTNAELLSIENDDDNKCFGITFKTPPDSSDGLPHIMEHSVLAGSEKYPLKEPFVELVKGSLATFINAFTGSDATYYPTASMNLQDFYNLIDVYMDAVLYPTLTPEILMQEGWHYEMEDPNDPMIYKGVVFNEMKGAYSNPDRQIYRQTSKTLFPDSTYGVDSGGDPTVIPDLMFEKFKVFHETMYHPSNARIFFYGDDPVEERLRLMDEYLKAFSTKDVDATIVKQEPFDEPVRAVARYDAGEQGKGMMTVGWVLDEQGDAETMFGFQVLEHILMGTAAAPLRRALVESNLGEDVLGGLNDSQLQIPFYVGMKGINVENAGKIEELILDTLSGLAKDGIDPDTIQASLNTIEFGLREFNAGGFPRGLAVMMRVMSDWIHLDKPIDALYFEEKIASVRERIEHGGRYFEGLIEQYFINNLHRATVILEPDQAVKEEREAEETQRLVEAKAGMDEDDIQSVIETTARLKEMQVTPDTDENLAKLPSLKLEDLDPENKIIPIDILSEGDVPILYHDLFTNGIVYLDVGFDLKVLPIHLLPYGPLFGTALLEMGTDTESYVQLIQRIGIHTGGISPSNLILNKRTSDDYVAKFMLRAKTTVAKVDQLIALLQDILLKTQFDNQERFMQIAQKRKSRMEAQIISAGHNVASGRIASQLTASGWVSEQISGVDSLFFLRDLITRIESDWSSVLADLEAVRSALVSRCGLLLNVTVDDLSMGAIRGQLNSLIESIPVVEGQLQAWQPFHRLENEGLAVPSQVNYVGMGGNLFDLGYELRGSFAAIQRYLFTTWMWERVRVQGGAYGGMCRFNASTGLFTYLSYRDPNLLGTLKNYRGAGKFLEELSLSDSELTKTIIGGIGSMDTAMLPDAKGDTSMQRYLTGYTDEMRQQHRTQLLSTSVGDFHMFGQALTALNDKAILSIVGPASALEEANKEQPGLLEIKSVL